MNRSLAIFLLLSGLLTSFGIVLVAVFADRITSFRMKNRSGQYVEVFRPNSATWIKNVGVVVGFIGIVASLIAMFIYRSR
jgi:hypothetical protein